jgi:hypothetical protein
MIKIQNVNTNEIINVLNVVVEAGRIISEARRPHKGTKFYNSYPMMVAAGESEDGRDLHELAEGWELVTKGTRKPRQPKQESVKQDEQPQVREQESVKTNDEQEVNDDVNVKQEEREELPQPPQEVIINDEPQDDVNDDDVNAIAAMLLKLKKGSAPVNKDMVVKIVKDILAEELPKVQPQEVQHTIKVADLPEYKCPKGTNPKLLELLLTMVVNDRVIGRFPWLFGPAGSGKSTLASKVAEALNIPFYSVSSLQQKYELEGYTDAVGEFVQTAFYKAMAEGGVFCFDEISTTSGEVQVAFNTAAAQLVYNFPKMGMVKAHENFHIIACDNSTGRGGDKRYISRFQLDASTLDRYNFVEVDYSEEHDLNMAAGDKDLVKFMNDMRKVLDASNTTYLATPRASKAIKALQATGMSDKDALWYGLCSGWNKQDIRTFSSKLSGSTNWHKAFDEIVYGL